MKRIAEFGLVRVTTALVSIASVMMITGAPHKWG